MTSIDHTHAAHTPISYKHEPPSAHRASSALHGHHQKQKKRQTKTPPRTDKQLISEQAQSSSDELERMWHRGYMMALKDILVLFDDTRVPKT